MSELRNPAIHEQAQRRFQQRCLALGATLWQATTAGQLQPVSKTDLPGGDWLLSTAMQQRLASTLRLGSALQEPVEEIDTDVYAVVLDDRDGAMVALMLGQRAGTGAGFEADCKTLGISPEYLLNEIRTTPRYQPADLKAVRTMLGWSLRDLREIDEHNYAIEDLTTQLSHSYENITLLYRMGRSMSTLDAPALITQSICTQLCETQGFGWVATRFRGEDQGVPELSGQCMLAGRLDCDIDQFNKATDRMIQEWHQDSWSKLLQIGTHELADLAGSEIILDPIHHDGRIIGVVMAGGKTGPDPEATSNDTQLVDAIASFLGTFHENAARFHEQRNMFIGTLEAVSAALDAKDRYTCGHSERVAYLATILAQSIGLDEQEIDRIRIAGLVHDVGKIGVPEAVLCKTGRLTDDEFEKIKRHPRIGYNILKGIPKMDDVLDGVLYHHERWDGRGYPDRLAGESIPLYGRILAVCDTFDAMSSTRSYRRAMPREEVLEEIMRCAGSQFDPQLTGPFIGLNFREYDDMVRRHQDLAEQENNENQAAA